MWVCDVDLFFTYCTYNIIYIFCETKQYARRLYKRTYTIYRSHNIIVLYYIMMLVTCTAVPFDLRLRAHRFIPYIIGTYRYPCPFGKNDYKFSVWPWPAITFTCVSCARIGTYIFIYNKYRRVLQSSAHSTKISAYIVLSGVCIVHGYKNVAIGDCWQKKKIIYHVGRARSEFCSGVVVVSHLITSRLSVHNIPIYTPPYE